MRQILQNEAAISLQNATKVYYKMHQAFYDKIQQFCCKTHYKMRRFYYKLRQLSQKCVGTNYLRIQ